MKILKIMMQRKTLKNSNKNLKEGIFRARKAGIIFFLVVKSLGIRFMISLVLMFFFGSLEASEIFANPGNLQTATFYRDRKENAFLKTISFPSKKHENDNNPEVMHRTVIHSEAYKKREGIGPHLNVKITPPEKRGRKGRVLVEVYNYSKVNFSVISFWLVLTNQWGDRVEVEIKCDDILGGWSALKWVKIPGNGEVPEITKVEVQNMKSFNDKSTEVKIKYTTDLIKK